MQNICVKSTFELQYLIYFYKCIWDCMHGCVSAWMYCHIVRMLVLIFLRYSTVHSNISKTTVLDLETYRIRIKYSRCRMRKRAFPWDEKGVILAVKFGRFHSTCFMGLMLQVTDIKYSKIKERCV
jgi:hypothetical protein